MYLRQRTADATPLPYNTALFPLLVLYVSPRHTSVALLEKYLKPSILSFFGKGSSTTAPRPKAASKKSNGTKPGRKKAGLAATSEGSSSSARSASTPAAKRRKVAGAAGKTVDLTAGVSTLRVW